VGLVKSNRISQPRGTRRNKTKCKNPKVTTRTCATRSCGLQVVTRNGTPEALRYNPLRSGHVASMCLRVTGNVFFITRHLASVRKELTLADYGHERAGGYTAVAQDTKMELRFCFENSQNSRATPSPGSLRSPPSPPKGRGLWSGCFRARQ
jgi:hypothetical protein